VISKQTARDIWIAYDEIEKATKLLAFMQKAIEDGTEPTPRNAFGATRALQLGVPSGDNCHQLFDVQPRLALAIIKAHIADKQAACELACETARKELEASK